MRSEHTALAAVILLALAGCAAPRTVLQDSAIDRFAALDAELDFWDALATQTVVTNHDAIHGLLLIAGNTPPESYESGLADARRHRWLSDEQQPKENESAPVGLIAVAVCDLIGVQGGLSMRLFGPSPRACTRELVYLGLLPRRTENQSLSGLEFIDLVSRVERFDAPDGDPS